MSKNDHDHTFKLLLRQASFVIPLLKTYLPEDIQKLIHWDTLELYQLSGDHKEEKTLNEHIADVVYQARIQDELGFLWIHFEHQGQPDAMMPMRTVNYQSSELLKYVHANGLKKCPPIISIVYYQGKRPYPYSMDIADCFESPELSMRYFSCPLLIDLASLSDEELTAHAGIGPVELLLKHIRLPSFSKNYRGIIQALQTVGDAERRIVIRYLIERADISENDLKIALLDYLPKDEDIIMTVAEQIGQRYFAQGIQEGTQEGMQKGAQREKEVIAKNLFLKGLEDDIIAESTGLSKEMILRIKKENLK